MPFLVDSNFSDDEISNILCCLSYHTVNIKQFSSQTPVCHCNISNICDWWEVNQLGQTSFLSFFFFTNEVMCHALWCHLSTLPQSILNIWRRGRLTALLRSQIYCINHWIEIYQVDRVIHLFNNWSKKRKLMEIFIKFEQKYKL